MLEMRPDCERCGRDLQADGDGAMICSFECTFCVDCATGPLAGDCPNCGGVLRVRPSRSPALLTENPASTLRKGPR